jgi:hypothetical protein
VGALAENIGERHSTVLRMFNERSSSWAVTDDRVNALASIPVGLEGRHVSTITAMVDAAVEGAKHWGLTAERFSALRRFVELANSPAKHDIANVIQRMQLGGMRDGVADREWFVAAMEILLHAEGDSSND